MNWKDSLTSIIRWTLPFSTCGWRENPLLTVANFVLHIGILLAVLFYSAHNVMWDTISVFPFLPCPTALWTPYPSYHSGLSGPRLAPTGSPGVKLRDPTGRLVPPCCSSPASMVTGFASAHGFGSESFMLCSTCCSARRSSSACPSRA